MMAARVAGVPRPFARIASRNSSSSTNLPAPSIAESSVASLKRAGGFVSSCLTSMSRTFAGSLGEIGNQRLVRLPLRERSFPSINRQPARIDDDLAVCFERVFLDSRDARRDFKLRRREKDTR